MKSFFSFLLVLFSFATLRGQSVGVVLSGGGAKGLYHIGILKALEENDIPVDYISGTSMGAIVAGLYAIGYTPEEIAEIFLSDQVKLWLTGRIESRYFFYFKRMAPDQAMVTLNLDFNSDKNVTFLPTNLIPSTQLDMAFNEYFAGATAAAGGDFNRMFIPFRCIASDVYNKKEVVFRSGDMGRAIRASMAIPLAFKPIKQDSLLLYDGGIYNNFPWQVLEEDFDPDVLIGGKCVVGYKNPDENNIIEQIETITMSKTDFNLPPDKGVLIDRVFDDVSMLDFTRAQYIMDRGYEDAMAKMDSIKMKVRRRTNPNELHNRRLVFRSRMPVLMMEDYQVTGLTADQSGYVRKIMGLNDPKDRFSFQQFKSEYFKILSEGDIEGDYPRMFYDDTTGYFTVRLDLSTKPSFRVKLGGNISSSALNQAYVGLEYKDIRSNTHSYRVDGSFSALYTSVTAGTRMDFFWKRPMYFDVFFNYNHYNYQKGSFSNAFRRFGYSHLNDTFFSASTGIPTGRSSVMQLRVNAGIDNYFYYPQGVDVEIKPNRTNFKFYGLEFSTTKRTLDYLLYPTSGIWQQASLIFVDGREKPYEWIDGRETGGLAENHRWFGARYQRQDYFQLGKWFTVGTLVDAVISDHATFENHKATRFTAPSFHPFPLSHSLFIEEYRSKTFVGLGAMPIFRFVDNFYLKTGAYVFASRDYLKFRFNSDAKLRYLADATLVYQTPIGPASLSVSRFDAASHRWFVVFNFGTVIFNRKGLFY